LRNFTQPYAPPQLARADSKSDFSRQHWLLFIKGIKLVIGAALRRGPADCSTLFARPCSDYES
jgi:hypothetical protein